MGADLEFHYENGRIWLEEIHEDTQAKQLRIPRNIEQIEGGATANLDLSTGDIMRMSWGED